MLGDRQYYALVAGLREYSFDSDAKGFDARTTRDEIVEQLSREDRRTVELFYGWNDISNIVNMLAGRSLFDEMGNLSRDELTAALTPGQAGEEARENLPGWMGCTLGAYLDPENPDYEDTDRSAKFERALFEAYYAECAASKCRFLREWSRFDRNLRNVIAAHTAREKNWPVVDALVGSDDIVLSLTKSSAADFALKGELEYIDTLMGTLGASADIVAKERTVDLIRRNKADELSESDTFGMSAILAYLVKIGIIQRWVALDPATGREMYEQLLTSMKNKIEI